MEGNSNAQDYAGIRRRIQKDIDMFDGSIAEARNTRCPCATC